MHLWPSTMIRDSFKIEYLKKVEWNIRRMNREKQQSSSSSANHQYLLDKEVGADANSGPSPKSGTGFFLLIRDSLMVCCCCCLCCGVCIDEEAM